MRALAAWGVENPLKPFSGLGLQKNLKVGAVREPTYLPSITVTSASVHYIQGVEYYPTAIRAT